MSGLKSTNSPQFSLTNQGMDACRMLPDDVRVRNRVAKRCRSPRVSRESTQFLELVSGLDVGSIRPEQALAAILSCYYSIKVAHQLADEVIETFGSLDQLLAASVEDVTARSNISREAWYLLRVVKRSFSLVNRANLEKKSLLNSELSIFDYFESTIGQETTESVRVLFLDGKNYLIKDELHSTGTLSTSAYYPRELVKRSCQLNASAVIVVHNHPSGDPAPSLEDRITTRNMKCLLDLINVSFHDHLIIGHGKFFSFRREGYLA